MILLLGLLLQTAPGPADDFYVARLKAGEDLMRIGRPADALVDLRIAGFGFLDRPALLCEALGVQALAEEASGHADESAATLRRLAEIRGAVPACRDSRIDAKWRAELDALVRRRTPSLAAAWNAPPPASPAPPVAASSAPSVAAASAPTPRREPAGVPPTPTAVPVAAAAPVPAAATPEARPRTAPPPAPAVATPAPAAPPPPSARPSAAAPEGGAPVSTEELDRQPQIQRTARPVYPTRALQARVGGIVLVRALVSPAGEPVRVEIARGVEPDLDQAALAAVRQWRFEPGQKAGSPVLAWTTVAVPFDLNRP